MKIYGFYHVCAMNDYPPLVYGQIKNLLDSKLLSKTDTLFVNVVGDSLSVKKVDSILKNTGQNNYEIIYHGDDFKQYEFPTINLIKQKSESEDFYCYYFHTKGISITNNNCSFYGSRDFNVINESVNSWRLYMEHYIFDHHDGCIEKLKEFDAVGVSLTDKPSTHYPGNFWWSKSDHIKKLTYIDTKSTNRYVAEFWIGNLKKINFYCMCNKGISYTEKVIGF